MADDERKQPWVEVSLLVEDELAETVAEVLTRYLSRGVVIERPAEEESGGDRGRDEVQVTGYLAQDAQFEERKKKIRQALYYLGRIRPLPEPEFSEIESEDWSTAWQERYRPLQLGGRLMIVPTWLENPQPDLVPLYLDPGMAFGSGTHPSTQLALELILEVLELETTEAVLDIGCGSGILAIAAVKLGAGRAVGVDVDPESVRIARDNAAANGVGEQTAFQIGSVPEIQAGQFALRKAPLVAANLIAPLLHQLLEEGLTELVAPGGHLVLSGLLEDQAGPITRKLRERQVEVLDRRQQADWVGLLCGSPMDG